MIETHLGEVVHNLLQGEKVSAGLRGDMNKCQSICYGRIHLLERYKMNVNLLNY